MTIDQELGAQLLALLQQKEAQRRRIEELKVQIIETGCPVSIGDMIQVNAGPANKRGKLMVVTNVSLELLGKTLDERFEILRFRATGKTLRPCGAPSGANGYWISEDYILERES